MAISVTWATKVINVPQADLTSIGGGVYELDADVFRLALKALEASEDGMTFEDTHQHNTEVTLAGATFARTIEIINGYTVTFEDGQYAVNIIGANTNISDVTNVNQVSVRSFNSAGLVVSGSGVTSGDKDDIADRVLGELVSDHSSTTGSLAAVINSLSSLVDELHKLGGLDASNPLVIGKTAGVPTTRRVPANGSIIDQEIDDDSSSTTVTRQ